ncbi:amidohydrolase family protein [Microbacterium sp. NPDC058062]|uniref:amidohydrolase family protein n=1 Tax=Microbacterium sp. NPDC058062 TaxID=3346320 RepID=UPI0036DD8585
MIPAAFALVGDDPAARDHQSREENNFGAEASAVNQAVIKTLGPKLVDVELRLSLMDQAGIDHQLVSPSPVHYYEWADEDKAILLSRAVNDGMAQLVSAEPRRLTGLGVVPLRYPDRAVQELRRAVEELELAGVEIPTTGGDFELSSPLLDPFWQEAEDLGALIFLHPWGCTLGTRLDRYYLANTVGQPVETAVALSHLIFSGVLDRHPRLKILAAHGGGYLPTYIGRSDHAWHVRPDARTCTRRPSDYLRDIYYDSLVYDSDALHTLLDRVGPERVLMGSDYPFDMGVDDPVSRIDAAALTPEIARDIKGRTAAGLLRRRPASMHRPRQAPTADQGASYAEPR